MTLEMKAKAHIKIIWRTDEVSKFYVEQDGCTKGHLIQASFALMEEALQE